LVYWPLLLPPLALIPLLFSFPYPSSEAPYSDITISHYPAAVYLRFALSHWKTVPLWSPDILSGYPFFADPLSGLWYPPAWLALLLPLPFGFNFLVMSHLLWGGIGMYRWLRLEGLAPPAAIFGALAFQLMPKLAAHFGGGHLTLVFAVTWTPWLIMAARGDGLQLRLFERSLTIPPGLVLAAIILADIRWAAYAGTFWFAATLALGQSPLRQRIVQLAKQILLAGLLSAPLLLPLLEYTRLSTRAYLTAQEVLDLSLPITRLLGFLFPDWGGFHEWVVYPGGAVLALALSGLGKTILGRWARFLFIIACLSLVFSLGSQVPGMQALASLPGLGLLRVPSRALFLTGFCLAALAAYQLDGILERPPAPAKRRAGLILTALAGFALTLTAGLWFVSGVMNANFIWGTFVIILAALWIGMGRAGVLRQGVWITILLGLATIDLGLVNYQAVSGRSQIAVMAEGGQAAQFLSSQPGRFRVYSPSYSLPQHTAAQTRLELADGVNPLQLDHYTAFMERATGVPREGYSVTLPPFSSGDPKLNNLYYTPDAVLLGWWNVAYVASAYDIIADGLVLREQFGETRIYENQFVLPRAWVQPVSAQFGVDARPAPIIRWTPNHITIEVDQMADSHPALLVLSEKFYPGWNAYVDGRKIKVQTIEGVFRGIELPTHAQRVDFIFRPLTLYLGLAFWLVGMTLLIRGQGRERSASSATREIRDPQREEDETQVEEKTSA
jgi:hypothetical protein